MIGDGAEHFGGHDVVAFLKEWHSEGAVEQDGREPVRGIEFIALLVGDAQQARFAVRTQEVVAEGGDRGGLTVHVVDLGEALRFVDDADHVLGEARGYLQQGGAQQLFGVMHLVSM